MYLEIIWKDGRRKQVVFLEALHQLGVILAQAVQVKPLNSTHCKKGTVSGDACKLFFNSLWFCSWRGLY